MLLEILTDKSTNEYLSLYSFPFYHTYLVSLNIPLFLPPHKHPMPVIPVYWALGLPEEKSLWLVWKDRYFKWSVHTQPGHLAACLGHVDGTGKMEIAEGTGWKTQACPIVLSTNDWTKGQPRLGCSQPWGQAFLLDLEHHHLLVTFFHNLWAGTNCWPAQVGILSSL